MKKWLNEIELEGSLVKLVPLSNHHQHALYNAASDGELWNIWFTSIPDQLRIAAYINFASTEYQADRSLPFVVIDRKTDRLIGTTRYCNATPNHKRLEIGYTWYAASYQRTGVNTECKYLLLSYAFEQLDCMAVEFRTHYHNVASRLAIERLGGKQDGILRNHQIDEVGTTRDTVVFSIINNEWTTVKKSLEYKMNKYAKL